MPGQLAEGTSIKDYGPGMVTLDEFKHMFQLCYMLLSRVSDIDLINEPLFFEHQDKPGDFGSSAEFALVSSIFAKGAGPAEP